MIADTSFLLALLNKEDAHHEKARIIFEREGPPAIQQTVLAESLQVLHLLVRRTGSIKTARARERDALRIIRDHFRMHVIPVQDAQGAMRTFEEHQILSLVDACGIADARASGGLLTFDTEQDRLARAM